jgi:anti-anti-sigma factor
MAFIRSEVSDETRIIFIDQVRLVDAGAIEQCYREIIEVLDKSEERSVLLHFGRVAFLSSAALGALIRVNKKCTEYKITLKLSNIAPDIYQVFKITRLDKVFSIHADATDALAAFKSSGHSLFRSRGPSSYEVT